MELNVPAVVETITVATALIVPLVAVIWNEPGAAGAVKVVNEKPVELDRASCVDHTPGCTPDNWRPGGCAHHLRSERMCRTWRP
jgi:hypothetical protein